MSDENHIIKDAVDLRLLPDDETHPHYVDPATLAPPPIVRGTVPDNHPIKTGKPIIEPHIEDAEGYTVEQTTIH